MAQLKQCNECGKVKEVTQFSKRKASKDGLQMRCKKCNAKDNHKYRTEINPEHHAIWQKHNMDKHMVNVSKFRKADKSSKIYYIKAPDNMVYIGMTQMHLSVRFIEHKAKYNAWMLGKRVPQHPSLFESFKKHGIENHQIGILYESDSIDRKQLRQYEKMFIKGFMDLGIALNKQI